MNFSIYNRQRLIPIDIAFYQNILNQALTHASKLQTPNSVLNELTEIEISIVSPRLIKKVHLDFMNLNTVTDVITFHHGEIIVCAQVAQQEAPLHHHSFSQELSLYMIHGLLHLCGWNDIDPEERQQMHHHQDQILRKLLK